MRSECFFVGLAVGASLCCYFARIFPTFRSLAAFVSVWACVVFFFMVVAGDSVFSLDSLTLKLVCAGVLCVAAGYLIALGSCSVLFPRVSPLLVSYSSFDLRLVMRWHLALSVMLGGYVSLQIYRIWPFLAQAGGLGAIFGGESGLGYRRAYLSDRIMQAESSFDGGGLFLGSLGYILFLGTASLFTGAVLFRSRKRLAGSTPLLILALYSAVLLERASFLYALVLFLCAWSAIRPSKNLSSSGLPRSGTRLRSVAFAASGAVLLMFIVLQPVISRKRGAGAGEVQQGPLAYVYSGLAGLNGLARSDSSLKAAYTGSLSPFPPQVVGVDGIGHGNGVWTFQGLAGILSRLGIWHGSSPSSLNFVPTGPDSLHSVSNVYTFLLYFYYDGGWIWLLFGSLAIGACTAVAGWWVFGRQCVWVVPIYSWLSTSLIMSFFGLSLIRDFRYQFMIVFACWLFWRCKGMPSPLLQTSDERKMTVMVPGFDGTEKSRAALRLSRLWRTTKSYWWVPAVVGLIGAVLGFGFSLTVTPVYESTALLYVTSGSDANSQTAYQGSLASQQRVSSYVKLVSSDAVVKSALDSSGVDLDLSDAKSRLSASATPETVLLSISAKSTNSSQAAALANAVAVSLTNYVSTLEQPASGGVPLAKLTVVSPASPSISPVSPSFFRNSAVGFAAGFMLGLLVLTVNRRVDTRLSDKADVERLGQTVLGEVPTDGSSGGAGVLDFSSGHYLSVESYRKIRTNLSFVGVDDNIKSIIVTSPGAGEGKSTVTSNLASSLVESGYRVLLIDADLRRPSIASMFELNGGVGLSDCLRGACSMEDAVQASSTAGLSVLCSGSDVPNPSELLGSKRAGELFKRANEAFDYVLVDSPPVGPVTDAVVASKWVDGILLVVRAGLTREQELEECVTQIAAARTRLLGVVVNCADGTSLRYGHYYSSRSSTVKGDVGRALNAGL